MGIIKQGIFGGFTNKTGPLVGLRRGNQYIIRSLPLKSSKPATIAQIRQRKSFGQISTFLSYIKPLIDIGYFKNRDPDSAMNRAMRANLKSALVNVEGMKIVDYTRISFSQGKLPLPAHIQVEAERSQIVKFSWAYHNDEDKWKAAEDRCSLLIYNEEKQAFFFEIEVASRAHKQHRLAPPSSFKGDSVLAFISFRSARSPDICSYSYYAGRVTII